MSSLRDVASAAGVSRMTVSNVINGHHNKVSAATLARVRRVIADLEYVPDAQARSLAASRSRMIGVIIHHPDERRDLLENPHDAILLGAIERAVTAHGYSLITASSADVVATARNVGSWRTDGLIVYGSFADEINELERTQTQPLVFLDNYSRDDRVHVVGVDDRHGGLLAGQHLIELGHRRLAFAGPLGATDGVVAQRLAGLRSAVAAAPGVEVTQVLSADHGPCSAALVAEQLVAEPDRPTAVIAASDTLAAELVGELLDRGVDVPGHVSVIGFDDTAVSRWMRPQLTTIRQDIPAKASMAVEVLLRLIGADADVEADSSARLPMSLVRRQSTAPPASR